MSILAGLLATGIRSHSAAAEPSLPRTEDAGPAVWNDSGGDAYSILVKSGRYKSITTPLEWKDIPRLAVLTGVNGSGKSQLLKALAIHYGDSELRRQSQGTDIAFAIQGDAYRPHEVLFLEDMAKPLQRAVASVSHFETLVDKYRSQQQSNLYENEVDKQFKAAGTDAHTISIFQALYHNPRMTERAIAFHFVAYLVNCGNALYRAYKDQLQVDLNAEVGPPPWDELNAAFAAAGFSYRLRVPDSVDMTQKTQLLLEDVATGSVVLLDDLSSGEATIVRFLFMIFAAKREFFCPRLILLDEPDAHLHPSLVHSFMKLLQDVVQRYHCRIIMSTHRMETVGFAPEGAVFLMQRNAPRIRRYDGKIRAIGLLTGNLCGLILADKRPVFVEAEDDEKFYSVALKILVREQLWEHPLLPEFVSISALARGTKAGGRTAVEAAVRIMSEAGLEGNVSGLVDRDDGAPQVPGIFALDRYAIENYLLDPLVIYAVLMGRRTAPSVELEQELSFTDEHKIRTLAPRDLQKIADVMITMYEPRVPLKAVELSKGDRQELQYTNGKRIVVPVWLVNHKGHELRGALTGLASGINNQELLDAFERVGLVPEDLRTAMLKTVSTLPGGIL